MLVFPPDLIPLINDARRLPFAEIIQRCRVSKQFNQAICLNDYFWRDVAKDRLTTLRRPTTTETKRALQVYERAQELLRAGTYNTSFSETPLTKHLHELAAGGNDIAVIELLRQYPRLTSLPYIAAAEGASTGGYDSLIQSILKMINNVYARRAAEQHVAATAATRGDVQMIRKYMASLEYDSEDFIRNATRYISQHPDRTDLLDLLIEIVDNYGGQYTAFHYAILNDVPVLFDRYLPNMNQDQLAAALQNTIRYDRKEYFDAIITRAENSVESIAEALSLTIAYDHEDMFDVILNIVREAPRVIQIAFDTIIDSSYDFVSYAILEKLLPYIDDESRHQLLDVLPGKKEYAITVVNAVIGDDDPDEQLNRESEQRHAARFLKEYSAIEEVLRSAYA